MKGDFSRGFDPDRKRGQAYRRILLQQGRVLLDSDFNASIDAQDQLIREVARDLGCRAGSPDLGFLITPGRLLALFDPHADIEAQTTGNATAVRDYNRKYLDRYPALRVAATAGGGTVRIPFLVPLPGTVTVALWVLADVATNVAVTGGGNVAVPVQPDFARRTVALTDASSIEIALDPGEEIWIAMIETDVDAGLAPSFGVREGRYHVEGLSVDATNGPIVLFDIASAPIPNGVTVVRDDAVMLFDSLPSYRVTAAVAGSVRFPFRFGVNGPASVELWLRAAVVTQVVVTGAGAVAIPGPTFTRFVLALNNPTEIEIALDAGEEIWLGLVALANGGGFAPGLWPAVGFGPDAGFAVPDLAVPDGGGTRDLQVGDRLVVYLEAGERHITAVEDLGLRERALGNGPDTTTRSLDLGQAKLAPANDLDADTAIASAEAIRALRRRRMPTGTLRIDTPPQLDDPDPCALPATSGYTGLDHRFYRFEVHVGGPLADTIIKFSPDNGSELFPLFTLSAAEIETLADTALRDGDLVELLSETIELGDAGLAALDPAQGRFTAPERAVGDLVRLRDLGLVANGTRRRFGLRDPNDEAIPPVVPVDPARYGVPGPMRLKARRWHGLIAPAGAAAPFSAVIEDGLSVILDGGNFEPGDWWQYEARVDGDNFNGAWRARPHGPERLFAPLALMRFQGPTEPLQLLAWLDERFPSLCSIDADDIAFDGGVCGTDANTVQEFLEELCDRDQGGCCDVSLMPETAGDDAERIRDELAELPPGSTAVVCLHRGIYRFATTLEIADRAIVVRGCPEALIVTAAGGAPAFRVTDGGRLVLDSLTVFGAGTPAPPTLIELTESAGALAVRDCGLINVTAPPAGARAIAVAGPQPDVADLDNPLAPAPNSNLAPGAPAVLLEGTTVVSRRGIVGGVMSRLRLHDTIFAVIGPAVVAADIGTADFDTVALRTGLDVATTAAWTADNLLARGELLVAQMLEDLPDAGGNQPAFVANAIWSGSAQKVFATGSHGFLLGSSFALSFGHGVLIASTAGIQIKSSIATSIVGQRITAGNDGVGLHLLHQAFSVKIEACEITSDEFGILIGAPRATLDLPGPSVLFLGLHVESNTIEAPFCIALGDRAEPHLNGRAFAVDIRANHVVGNTGFVLRGVESASQAVDARAIENVVVATVGFDIIGGRFTLQGNQVEPPPINSDGIAVRAIRSPRLLIEDNQLLSRSDDAKLGDGGVSLSSCAEVVLRGNTMGNSGQFPALSIASSGNARVTNNVVNAGNALLSSCVEPLVQGNDFARAIVLSRCTNGTVTDNRSGNIGNGDALMQSLWIANAAGSWQVEDNRAAGRLIILPRPLINGGLVTGGFGWLSTLDLWHARTLRAVDALSVGDEALPEDITVSFASRAEATRFLAIGGNLGAVVTEAVTAAIDNAFDGVLIDAFPGLAVLETEETFHVQANGNWAFDLTIGHPARGSANPQTTVQAIGNRVQSRLFVRPYRLRNVSQNLATQYPAWIASQPGPIGADNLDFA